MLLYTDFPKLAAFIIPLPTDCKNVAAPVGNIDITPCAIVLIQLPNQAPIGPPQIIKANVPTQPSLSKAFPIGFKTFLSTFLIGFVAHLIALPTFLTVVLKNLGVILLNNPIF